ncbi:ribosome biogenesis GTPase Der [Candidatus Sulfidibacterium hydrothermale]|uniref:ribosome biogenesis GTPase Der n=1 Tax=Candidatus Sulfidibacterium hydrothermale TaxID=2875962 RepID=UPI001F0A785E|nr:ribosome biogenesis GTPase Der [Candidatus Sulfidibacterium hydrothermale]UBM61970.1 ribosome biogenesis GTPase Der [Candidatus Sulfidibacterium hydrothermale]
MNNIVAIVGRPNVGKSTLFNRLTGSKTAIVESVSGVTRDRIYGKSDWNGKEFSVIDTGGFVQGSDDIFEEEIRKQVLFAIDEADVIIFVVDAREGIHPLDEDVAELLRRSSKKVFIAANKVDTPALSHAAADFYALGLGEVYPISSVNGSGTGDLLDEMVKEFRNPEPEPETPDVPRIAVIGRPNVGKSSLINTLIGDTRNIVTPIAGTTRDTVYTPFKGFGHDFMLVDTAGLRKKGKVYENIEFYSTLRTIRAIENADVCLVMIDASQGIEKQDVNIFHLAEKNRKGIVIVVNKWDLVEKDNNTHLEYEKAIRQRIAPFNDVPIVFVSVKDKQRVFKALNYAEEVFQKRSKRISTSKLNDLLLPIIEENPHPMVSRGRYVRIKYVMQLKTQTPQFVFFCNLPDEVKDPYKRFLENKIRQHFDFTGVPIQLFFRQK